MRHRLTTAAVKAAKPADKPYRLTDGQGLYLFVNAAGRYWRFDYRVAGKRKCLALGKFPDVSLAEARIEHVDAEALVRRGIDPVGHRKRTRAESALAQESTFAAVVARWLEDQDWSTGHRRTVEQRLALNLLPWIGARPIVDLDPLEVEQCLARVVDRGALETAHRCATIVRQVYATKAVRRLVADRRMDELHDALPKLPPKRKRPHLAAVTDPRQFGALLRALDAFEGTLVVRTALQLSPLLFVRPGELRHAEWSEIDVGNALWAIPASKMKLDEDHLVPLPRQALELLAALRPLTGGGGYVFPSQRSPVGAPVVRQRPMSENTITAALRRIGFAKNEACAHGFRASARTMLTERLGYREPIVEKQLAHLVRDPNHGAYDRTSWLDERVRMMQAWADFCDALRDDTGETVVPFLARA